MSELLRIACRVILKMESGFGCADGQQGWTGTREKWGMRQCPILNSVWHGAARHERIALT